LFVAMLHIPGEQKVASGSGVQGTAVVVLVVVVGAAVVVVVVAAHLAVQMPAKPACGQQLAATTQNCPGAQPASPLQPTGLAQSLTVWRQPPPPPESGALARGGLAQ
jgi:hypothetical protein